MGLRVWIGVDVTLILRDAMKNKKLTTGADLRDARYALGWTTRQLGEALGYDMSGPRPTQKITDMEKRDAPPAKVLLLVECFLQGARPPSTCRGKELP